MIISGSLIQAYTVCPRQSWLMSHQITGDQSNQLLSIGRLYSEETYKREKKEILVNGNKIDVIKEENGVLTIIETKKSSKMLNASKMQLLNYLYSFEKMGYSVKGELRIPKEKKIIPVEFGEDEKAMIEALHKTISELVEQERSPGKVWIGACKNCSYSDFCWS